MDISPSLNIFLQIIGAIVMIIIIATITKTISEKIKEKQNIKLRNLGYNLVEKGRVKEGTTSFSEIQDLPICRLDNNKQNMSIKKFSTSRFNWTTVYQSRRGESRLRNAFLHFPQLKGNYFVVTPLGANILNIKDNYNLELTKETSQYQVYGNCHQIDWETLVSRYSRGGFTAQATSKGLFISVVDAPPTWSSVKKIHDGIARIVLRE